MLKKLFHPGQTNNNSSSSSLIDARLEQDEWNERTGYAQSVVQLDHFEARLRDTLRTLTRHCQAVCEMCASTSAFTDQIQTLLPENAGQPSIQANKRQSDEALGLVNMFRVSAIAPLQSLLILVPQLRVRCEHRNGAMQLMLRYQHKVNDIERSAKTKVESSRLQRNRAKLQAATARFRELDNHVQQEIRIIVANDISALVGSSTRELLLRAQILAAKFALDSGSQFRAPATMHSPTSSTPSDLAQGSIQPTEEMPVPATPQRRSAMIVLPPQEDSNMYVRQSVLAPPTQPRLIIHAREASATASDDGHSSSDDEEDDEGPTLSSYETGTDIHEGYGIGKRKKHIHGTRTWDIHRHIKDNMSTGLDHVECVRLPDGFARDEWIAVHVVDFFNEINLLYGTISEFCTAETCPRMSAGPCYAYTWTDMASAQQTNATHLPATQYVARLMDWIENQINDPLIFPTNATQYQPDFEQDVARVILKRLFRVYAHMYHSHLDHFTELNAEVHLGFCFKRFVCFIKEFDLVDQKELNALRKLVQNVLDHPIDTLVPELLTN